MRNEYDANNALASTARRAQHRSIYTPQRAEPSAWTRAAIVLLTLCTAGAGFAWVLVHALS